MGRLLALVRSFSKVEQYKPALLFLSLLGFMAAMLQLVKYAQLRMLPEATLEPQVALHDPSNQGSQPGALVVVGQRTPVPENGLVITQYHHRYHYGCEPGGVGQSLSTARVDHGTLQ